MTAEKEIEDLALFEKPLKFEDDPSTQASQKKAVLESTGQTFDEVDYLSHPTSHGTWLPLSDAVVLGHTPTRA